MATGTNGYFVMRVADSGIELTAEIVDETIFPEREVIPKRPVDKDHDRLKLEPDDPYTQKGLDGVVGFEGGEGWHWGQDPEKTKNYGDEPMVTLSEAQMRKAKVSENLWLEEEVKSEEIPEDLRK